MFSDSSSTTTTESEVSGIAPTGSDSSSTAPGYIPISMSDLSDTPSNMAQDEQGNYYQQYKGQLKLNVYINYGLLTVHVVSGRHFTSRFNSTCDSYVKLSLVPDDTKRTRCKTEMILDSNSPLFDEKFSFELLEEDIRKRLFISVWHRDQHRNQCEFLGCMSFGVQHIQEQKKNITGWYYLLTGDIGKKKHLAVADPKLSGLSERKNREQSQQHSCMMEPIHIVVRRNGRNGGFGFSISGSNPVVVCRVDPGSHAERAGLQKDDCIVKIDQMNVSRSTSDSVARIIRHAVSHIILEIHRPRQLDPVRVDHLDNSPRKPLCHSTPAIGLPRKLINAQDLDHDLPALPGDVEFPVPWKPPSLSSIIGNNAAAEFETRDYGWLDGEGCEKENIGSSLFKHPGLRASIRSSSKQDDLYNSATLPRSMRFRSASSNRADTKYGLNKKPTFETKDYGWLDGAHGTGAHGTVTSQKSTHDTGMSKRYPDTFYSMGTLPRGKKVAFKDFV